MAMTDLVLRINRIFEGLVGCRMEFQPAHALSAEQWSQPDLELFKGELTQQPRYVASSDTTSFGFPINLHGTFAGLAVVHDLKNARHRKLLLLAELFTMVLEYGMHKEERRDRLRLIEERLHLLGENTNVIPLRPARFNRVLQVVDTDSAPVAELTPLTTKPLLIEATAGFPIQRVAVEVHQQSRRWAFVSSEDLPPDLFNSRESLEELGSMTLFIRDISTLTTEQQIKLAEYLATQPSADMPQVIAGAHRPLDELMESGQLLPHLVNLFCTSRLQWTDKPPEQVTIELIEASLQHILEQLRATHAHGDHFIPFHIQYLDPNRPTMH